MSLWGAGRRCDLAWRPITVRPSLEALEDRLLPSAASLVPLGAYRSIDATGNNRAQASPNPGLILISRGGASVHDVNFWLAPA